MTFLWSYAVDIAREHRTLLYISDSQEASGDALQSDCETSMRRHAVLEGIEVEMEGIRIHSSTEHFLAVVGLFMDTLTAGSDLQTAHEQVKAQCEIRVLRVIHRIERTVL